MTNILLSNPFIHLYLLYLAALAVAVVLDNLGGGAKRRRGENRHEGT
jgi:hypothetical protein